jgi:hypothetical protein
MRLVSQLSLWIDKVWDKNENSMGIGSAELVLVGDDGEEIDSIDLFELRDVLAKLPAKPVPSEKSFWSPG